ncbi:uroporphyrinogen decarboxylase family protein [Verrucomicrobiota bacterium]
MTSRERVLTALNHEEPDRTPLFVGTSGATSVLGPGYPGLVKHLGLPERPTRWLSKPLQYVWMDDDVLECLGSDGRVMTPGPAVSSLRKDISDDCMVDDWGCRWERKPGAGYFEIVDAPLRNATIDDLDSYPWPDLSAPSRFTGLADRCRAIQEAGYACVLLSGVTLFEQVYLMRGVEECLMDLAGDEDFYLALQDRIKSITIPYLKELLRHVDPYVDVLVTGDDLGTQDSTLMSPATYRRLIKPHQAEVLATIHETSKARIFFHSCGNVHALIGDLIDIGADILNPVQVSAGDMRDTARLKREFGKRLSFCGAIDTGWVMPKGTTDDVRNEVHRRITDLAPGGGYIAAAVHCIQPDVPPENIVAMCEACHDH